MSQWPCLYSIKVFFYCLSGSFMCDSFLWFLNFKFLLKFQPLNLRLCPNFRFADPVSLNQIQIIVPKKHSNYYSVTAAIQSLAAVHFNTGTGLLVLSNGFCNSSIKSILKQPAATHFITQSSYTTPCDDFVCVAAAF